MCGRIFETAGRYGISADEKQGIGKRLKAQGIGFRVQMTEDSRQRAENR
jgi:hypothetical protein